jgi:hypothetical protein
VIKLNGNLPSLPVKPAFLIFTAFNVVSSTGMVADSVLGTAIDTNSSGVVFRISGFKKTGAGALAMSKNNSLWSGLIVGDDGRLQVSAELSVGAGLITIGDSDIGALSLLRRGRSS